MGSRSATELLQLPVRLHGIRLGQPVDLVLDHAARRVLGVVVLCGDEAERFLAFPAAGVGADEIVAVSPLLLLEDVAFYRARGRSLRDVLGAGVTKDGRRIGRVCDILLAPDGDVEALVVERDGRSRTVGPGAVTVEAARVPAV